jgi:hypothetical protein
MEYKDNLSLHKYKQIASQFIDAMQRIFKRSENKSVRSKTSKLFIRRPLMKSAAFN